MDESVEITFTMRELFLIRDALERDIKEERENPTHKMKITIPNYERVLELIRISDAIFNEWSESL